MEGVPGGFAIFNALYTVDHLILSRSVAIFLGDSSFFEKELKLFPMNLSQNYQQFIERTGTSDPKELLILSLLFEKVIASR